MGSVDYPSSDHPSSVDYLSSDHPSSVDYPLSLIHPSSVDYPSSDHPSSPVMKLPVGIGNPTKKEIRF